MTDDELFAWAAGVLGWKYFYSDILQRNLITERDEVRSIPDLASALRDWCWEQPEPSDFMGAWDICWERGDVAFIRAVWEVENG